MKQCDRADEVSVELSIFDNAVNAAENGIIFFEGDCDLSVNEIPSDVKSYFVGSEGGFSEKEISLAKRKGNKKTVSLGKRILRAETASVVATTLVQLKTGGLL
ncbi:MAG: RsmE family RNA methyltransferase [Clostridiales bacterium]|nr:MAG: RsmE family RNA methyltransferase [Clostridiales bacterium]